MPQARPLSPAETVPFVGNEPAGEEGKDEYQWSNWLSDPLNEIKFAGKVLKQSLVDPVVDAAASVEALDEGYQQVYRGTKGSSVYRAPDGSLAGNTPSQIEAQQGSIRAITQPLQYLGKRGQAARQSIVDGSADVLGATREEDLITNANARRAQGVGQFATETAVATALTGGLAVFAGPGKSLLPVWLQAAMSKVPGKGLGKWAAATGTEEAIAGVLQDPFANPALFSNLTPDDTPWTAAAKNMPGNALGGLLFGGVLEGSVRGIGALLPNSARRQRTARAQQEVREARQWLENNEIQEAKPDGSYEIKPEPPAAEEPQAGGSILDEYDQRRAEVVGDAEPEVEPVNPEAVEASVAVRALDQLDDQGLERLDQGEGTLDELNAELETPIAFVERPEALVQAPADKLAETTVPYADQLAGLSNDLLVSMADPRNSQRLFERVSLITGKELEDFTRADVLAGMEALRDTENIQFLPNRLDPQSGGLVDVNALEVAPERFQYKDNVNEEGQQAGGSLDKVERWSTDFEGVIDVWEDPADGKVYVVNGHNRLAKAKEMGIPSVRVNFINARNAQQARAFGAAANIASGSGTAFDAAKFLREQGLEDAQSLEAAGIPMASGLGRQGLALSKLPPGLFQDAVDGTLELEKALMIGQSGSSPENMVRLATMSRDLNGPATAELVQMAQTSPAVVEATQNNLFGEEFVNTLGIKADLAARVRSALNTDKNLFGRTAKDKAATKLAERGNTKVDQAAASREAQALGQALDVFQAEKYAAGTEIGRLLNEGTEDIANGANKAAVVRRVVAEITQQEPRPVAPKPEPEPEVELVGPELWQGMSQTELLAMREKADRKLLTDRKIKNREKLVSDFDDELAQPGNELGLEMPAKVRKAQEDLQANQDAIEFINWYDQRSDTPLTAEGRNDIKKRIIRKGIANGEIRADGAELGTIDNPDVALEELVLNPVRAINEEIRLAQQYARQDALVADAEARAERELTGYYEQDINEKLDNGLLDKFPEEEPAYPEPEGEPSYALPADVAKSKPRYGLGTVVFGNDLDRAAYIIRSKRTRSKGEDRIIASLEEQGYDIAQVRQHGEKVKKAIGDQVQEMTGSRRAPQSAMEIVVPEQTFGEQPFTTSSVAGDAFRERLTAENYVKPWLAKEAASAINDIVNRVAGGKPLKVKINTKRGPEIVLPVEHGGDGVTKSYELGSYDWSNDVMTVHDFLRRDADELLSTAYHEAWHRLQARFLTKGEMRILSGKRAKKRIGEIAGFDAMAMDKASIEMQAIAFEEFSSAKELYPDLTVSQFLNMQRYQSANDAFEQTIALEQQGIGTGQILEMAAENNNKFYAGANAIVNSLKQGQLTVLEKFFDRLYDVMERVKNFALGNGFTSVDDLFQRAYAGKLAKRKEIGLVFNDPERSPFAEDWLSDNAMSERLAAMEAEANAKQAKLREKALQGGC